MNGSDPEWGISVSATPPIQRVLIHPDRRAIRVTAAFIDSPLSDF